MPIEIEGKQRYSYKEIIEKYGKEYNFNHKNLSQSASRHKLGMKVGSNRFFTEEEAKLLLEIKQRGLGFPSHKKVWKK